MATYHILTPTERARLEKRRAENPSLPLTSTERAILRQREAEGQAQAKAEAQARQAAREAAVPEHERRPTNYARVVLERRLAADRPGNRTPASVVESLTKAAEDRDRAIDAEMEAKRRQHLLDTDPDVQGAVQYGEAAVKLAAEEDREEWARCVGVAKEGDYKAFWVQARELNAKIAEREKAKQVEMATERTATEAAYLEQRERANKAAAELQASIAKMKQSLAGGQTDGAN